MRQLRVTLLVSVAAFMTLYVGCSNDPEPVVDGDTPVCFTDIDCPPGEYCMSTGQCGIREVVDGDIDDAEPDSAEEVPDGDDEEVEAGDIEDIPGDTETDDEAGEEVETEEDEDVVNPDFKVLFQTPRDGNFVPAGSVQVKVVVISNVYPVTGVTFSVKFGEEAPVDLGTIETEPYQTTWETGALAEGAYTLCAQARNEDNDVATECVEVYMDISAPTVVINSPDGQDEYCSGDNLLIDVDAGDNLTKLEFSIDGNLAISFSDADLEQQTTFAIGNFQHIIPVYKQYIRQGVHTLDVVAEDKAGHPTVREVASFIVDNVKPEITIEGLAPGQQEIMGSDPITINVSDCSELGANSVVEISLAETSTPLYSKDLEGLHSFSHTVIWDELLANAGDYPFDIEYVIRAYDHFGNSNSKNGTLNVRRLKFAKKPTILVDQSYTAESAPALSSDETYVVGAINYTFFALATENGSEYWQCPGPCGDGSMPPCTNNDQSYITAGVMIVNNPTSDADIAVAVNEDGYLLAHNMRNNSDSCPFYDLDTDVLDDTGVTGLVYDVGMALGDVYSNNTHGQTAPLYMCAHRHSDSLPASDRVVCMRADLYLDEISPADSLPVELVWTKVVEGQNATAAPLYVNLAGSASVMLPAGINLFAVNPDTGSQINAFNLGADVSLTPVPNLSASSLFIGGGAAYANLNLNLGARDVLDTPLASKSLSARSPLLDSDGRHILILQEEDDLGLYRGRIMVFSLTSNSFDETPDISYPLLSQHRIESTPVLASNGLLYLADTPPSGSTSSTFYAFSMEDESILWQMALGGKVKAPLIMDTDGTAYFTASDGKLYAISTGSPTIDTDALWPVYCGNNQHTCNISTE